MLTIVAAACKHPLTGEIVQGSSHMDAWIKMIPDDKERVSIFVRFCGVIETESGPVVPDIDWEGFVASDGRYVNRTEALEISLAAKQVREGWLGADQNGNPCMVSEALIKVH